MNYLINHHGKQRQAIRKAVRPRPEFYLQKFQRWRHVTNCEQQTGGGEFSGQTDEKLWQVSLPQAKVTSVKTHGTFKEQPVLGWYWVGKIGLVTVPLPSKSMSFSINSLRFLHVKRRVYCRDIRTDFRNVSVLYLHSFHKICSICNNATFVSNRWIGVRGLVPLPEKQHNMQYMSYTVFTWWIDKQYMEGSIILNGVTSSLWIRSDMQWSAI